jgi:hypothetical protein
MKRRSTLDPQNTGKTNRKLEAFLPLFYFNGSDQSQTFLKLFFSRALKFHLFLLGGCFFICETVVSSLSSLPLGGSFGSPRMF